jgi:hypothetical protein
MLGLHDDDNDDDRDRHHNRHYHHNYDQLTPTNNKHVLTNKVNESLKTGSSNSKLGSANFDTPYSGPYTSSLFTFVKDEQKSDALYVQKQSIWH